MEYRAIFSTYPASGCGGREEVSLGGWVPEFPPFARGPARWLRRAACHVHAPCPRHLAARAKPPSAPRIPSSASGTFWDCASPVGRTPNESH